MLWPVFVCPASWPVDLSSFLPSSREGLYPKGTVIVLKHLAVVRHHDALFPPPQQIVRNPATDVDGREREVERIAELLVKLQRALTVDSLSVQETLSLIGVLVFCSVVIRVGRVHYRALIDAVTALGPNPSPKARVQIDDAMRDGVSTNLTEQCALSYPQRTNALV